MLYNHQQQILDDFPKKHLLAWECGVGKTLAAIKLADKINESTIVVCPKSLVRNWQEELKKFSDEPDKFIVMSKENFKKDADKLLPVKTLIIDEAHYFSGMKSQMHKSLHKYIKKHKTEYVYMLTATPYMSTAWNIYALARILGIEWNYMKFKAHFFNDVRMGQRIIPVQRSGMEEEIARLVSILGSTVKMEDCVDVPESVYIKEYFQLNQQQKKAIKDLVDVEHICRWTKTHQICGGTLKSDGYTEHQFFGGGKLERLLELIKEHPKIAVVCKYNNELEYISSKLKGIPHYIVNGATKDKHGTIEKINELNNGVALINAKCSEGYNMPGVPVIVFYSYDFSLVNYVQIRERIQRINAIQKCTYISLIVENTIDEDVYKTVVEKKQEFHIKIYEK